MLVLFNDFTINGEPVFFSGYLQSVGLNIAYGARFLVPHLLTGPTAGGGEF